MRLHHLALRTADLGRLERFYVDCVGLTPVRRDGERSVWLDASGTIVMLEQRLAEEPAPARGSQELVAFAIPAADGARWSARLEREGVPVEGRTSFTIYFRDPDGRRIAVSSYPDPLVT